MNAIRRILRELAGTRLQLARKGGIYLLASWVSQAAMLATWLILPWKLEPWEVGLFGLCSFIIDLSSRVVLLGMDSVLLRFYVDPARRNAVLGAAVRAVAVAVAVALPLLWFTRDLVPRWLSGLTGHYDALFWLILAAVATNAFATLAYSHFVASGEAVRFGKLLLLRSGILVAGFLGAAWLGFGIPGLLLVQIVAALVVLAASLPAFPAGWRSRPPPGALGSAAAYGVPMTVYAVFALAADYSGRVILGHRAELADVGVFQFYYQIATQLNGIWSSLNRAWTPHCFALLETDPPRAYRTVARFAAAGTAGYAILLAIFLGLAATGLFRGMIAPEYYREIDLFFLLLLGPLFACIYTCVYPVFFHDRRTTRISIVQCIVSVLTIGLTVMLAGIYSTRGAAAAWVLGIVMTPVVYVAAQPAAFPALRPLFGLLAGWTAIAIAAAAFIAGSASLAAAAALVLAGGFAVAAIYCRDDLRRLAALLSGGPGGGDPRFS